MSNTKFAFTLFFAICAVITFTECRHLTDTFSDARTLIQNKVPIINNGLNSGVQNEQRLVPSPILTDKQIGDATVHKENVPRSKPLPEIEDTAPVSMMLQAASDGNQRSHEGVLSANEHPNPHEESLRELELPNGLLGIHKTVSLSNIPLEADTNSHTGNLNTNSLDQITSDSTVETEPHSEAHTGQLHAISNRQLISVQSQSSITSDVPTDTTKGSLHSQKSVLPNHFNGDGGTNINTEIKTNAADQTLNKPIENTTHTDDKVRELSSKGHIGVTDNFGNSLSTITDVSSNLSSDEINTFSASQNINTEINTDHIQTNVIHTNEETIPTTTPNTQTNVIHTDEETIPTTTPNTVSSKREKPIVTLLSHNEAILESSVGIHEANNTEPHGNETTTISNTTPGTGVSNESDIFDSVGNTKVPLAVIETPHPIYPPSSQKVLIADTTPVDLRSVEHAGDVDIQASALGVEIANVGGSQVGEPTTTTTPAPTTERQPEDVDPLNIFVDDITYQRFPKAMSLTDMKNKILGKTYKKLYILEESRKKKKLFQHVRQLQVIYTLEEDTLYANYLFRFVFSRKCEEIERFKMGKLVGNTDQALFEKELPDGKTERVVFFSERPDDYVYFMSCTDMKVSPYACRDSYYVTLDSASDPPNQFPWGIASRELDQKMRLTFEDPRFIFNLVLMPCARQ